MASTQSFHSFDLPRIKRWLVVLPISILLHSILIHWAGLQIQPPSLSRVFIVHASLQHATSQAPDVDASGSSDSSKRAATLLPLASPSNSKPATEIAPHTSVVTHLAPKLIGDSTATAPSAPSRSTLQYNVNLPPSAALQYDVVALKKGIPLRGLGEIVWQANGAQYRISGSTEIVDGGVRTFQSEGEIGQSGIAPLLYTEKSSKKSATNTHFQRERDLISFSASTATYARLGSEQDRASIFWQLAGIGRGAPALFKANADLEMFVAGVRDGDTWHIHVLDEEEIALPIGKIKAWHLVRMPRPNTYEPQLDVWLAPMQDWYPVKFRYKQSNGDTLDMSLIKVSSTTGQ